MNPKFTAQKSKIDPLFKYRKIPWLLDLANIKNQSFEKRLKKLQAAIYDLDSYLEATWKTKQKDLKSYWIKIYESLAAFGLSKKEQIEWTSQIRKYQEHELSARKKKTPLRFSLRHLYYYKSCDVKLTRRLIYREAPGLAKLVKVTDWTAFDLITEVNDDIQDVYEDMSIYNCNRFLFEIHKNGKRNAQKIFESFIKESMKANRQRWQKRKIGNRARQVDTWTQEIGEQTLALLTKRLNQKKINQIDTAIILKKVY